MVRRWQGKLFHRTTCPTKHTTTRCHWVACVTPDHFVPEGTDSISSASLIRQQFATGRTFLDCDGVACAHAAQIHRAAADQSLAKRLRGGGCHSEARPVRTRLVWCSASHASKSACRLFSSAGSSIKGYSDGRRDVQLKTRISTL